MTTLGVLSHDKELLIFPIVSGLASAALLASFALGMAGAGMLEPLLQEGTLDDGELSPVEMGAIALGLLFHFTNYFLMTYFSAALIGAALIRLRGGDPSVSDGFAAANRCLGAILGYSLIAGTVGLILRALQDQARNNFLGRIVVGLLGMAWTLLTYLVVPVLVSERLGPIDSLKRSAGLLRQTWGEQIVANLGFGLIGFLFSLPGFIAIVFGVYAVTTFDQSGATLFILVAAAVLYWILLGVTLSALRGIYTAALYCFTQQEETRGFPVELLEGSFSSR